MLLCLDVGNTHIVGGVFEKDKILLRFRYETNLGNTSDQLGIFLRTVLNENKLEPEKIKYISACSVVPAIDYSLRAACIKYFKLTPIFLTTGMKTGIQIKTAHPAELGADLVAGAIASTHRYPGKAALIIDLGTATTLTAVSAAKELLGVAILPGVRMSMEALSQGAAKLFTVEIISPKSALGRTTIESIQAGLYYGHLGAMRELMNRMIETVFGGQTPVVIGTGGFSHLFENEKIFTTLCPDLVLEGLYHFLLMNQEKF